VVGSQPGTPSSTTAADAGFSQQGGSDALLAAWLIVDNEGEIAISQLGRQRAENDEVKRFAELMVADHTEMLTKLRTAAGTASAVSTGNGSDSNNPNSNRSSTEPGDTQARLSSSINGEMSSGDSLVARIKRELGAQCLQSKQQLLSAKQGADFDKGFMDMQVAMHRDAADTLKVFQRHATGPLRQIIEEGIQTTTVHLKHAQATKSMLEGKSPAHEASSRHGN